MKRPGSVNMLTLFAIYLAVWNGLRLGQAIAFWKILTEYGAQPGPAYIAISGTVWAIIGSLLAVGLWGRKIWAWKAAIGITPAYAAWYWFDRLVLQAPRANWLFALATTVTILTIVATLLLQRGTITFFRHDRPD